MSEVSQAARWLMPPHLWTLGGTRYRFEVAGEGDGILYDDAWSDWSHPGFERPGCPVTPTPTPTPPETPTPTPTPVSVSKTATDSNRHMDDYYLDSPCTDNDPDHKIVARYTVTDRNAISHITVDGVDWWGRQPTQVTGAPIALMPEKYW